MVDDDDEEEEEEEDQPSWPNDFGDQSLVSNSSQKNWRSITDLVDWPRIISAKMPINKELSIASHHLSTEFFEHPLLDPYPQTASIVKLQELLRVQLRLFLRSLRRGLTQEAVVENAKQVKQ